MSQTLPNLSLPLLQASQAQKHVTHNEALSMLDALVQLSVINATQESLPTATAGDRYLVPPTATGVWAEHLDTIASFDGTGWQYFIPRAGWLAYDMALGRYWHFNGTAWGALPQETAFSNLQNLGINTAADTNNRLSVNAPSTLLSHEGAGHQIKVNKASASDTASLLFQSNWSGCAEMGLNGSNDWSIKISPDGSTWQEALKFNASDGVVTGTSVQSAPDDTTVGRLMRADYGYGPGNVLGTVTQTAGQPSGAVLETNSNADGQYTRFADGLQICTSPVFTIDVNTPIAAQFKSAIQSWNFPIAFSSSPVVSGGNVSDVENMWISAGQSSISGCSAVAFAWSSITGGSFTLTAIGRWV